MQWQDILNSALTFGAGFSIWGMVYRLYKTRSAGNVRWPLPAYFFMWGLWHLYYHAYLTQWFTLMAGLGITLANGAWLMLIVHYGQEETPDV